MCYYKLSWIDKAIEYADYCIDRLNGKVKSDKYIYANIIKINCYSAKNDYLMAVEVSRNLIEIMEEKESIVAANIYNNLGIYLLELNKPSEALQYFNKSEELRREKDICNLSHTLIHKAEIYKRKELYSEAEKLLREGIELACHNNDHEYVLMGKQALLKLYEGTSNTKQIEELYISIIELLKNKNHQELKKTYLQLAEFYIKQGKLDKATVYMELSHNI